MLYEVFVRLYKEGKEYDNEEMYIAERGWQDWMDRYAGGDDSMTVIALLKLIYKLSKMTLREMRGDLSRVEFEQKYKIPSMSLKNWEVGKRKAPEYVQCMIAYVIFNDMWINGNNGKDTN